MKKIIKVCIVILVILIVIILNMFIHFKKENEKSLPNEFDDTIEDSSLYKFDTTVQTVKIRNNFYAVKGCVNKFFTYYSALNTTEDSKYIVDEKQDDNNKEALYSMLDDEYIKFNDINKDNILRKIPNFNNATAEINKMYVVQKSANTAIYFVYGILNDKINIKHTNFSMAVKVDMLNKTFKLLLQDYVDEKYNNIKVGENIEINVQNDIRNDTYNIFEYNVVLDDEYVKDVFDKLRNDFIYNPELVYDELESDYRSKRFSSIDVFKEYLKDNSLKNIMMNIEKYQKNVYDDYTQYVCIDSNSNYYIFREDSVMNYKIILDTYTIDLPEFIEKYKSATDQVKVGMNIQKIIYAINSKDYKYVYDKLDKTFKKNKYNTLNIFENKMKQEFYDTNKVEYTKFTKEGNIYIYNLNVKNGENENAKEKKLTIIMKLKENTDFEMSFNIE